MSRLKTNVKPNLFSKTYSISLVISSISSRNSLTSLSISNTLNQCSYFFFEINLIAGGTNFNMLISSSLLPLTSIILPVNDGSAVNLAFS